MAKVRQVTFSSDIEKDNENAINAELSEREQKLLDQIATLKTYISLLENALETHKFGQLELPKKLTNPLKADKAMKLHNILDVQTKLRYDLYHFMGMRCTNFESKFIFEISSTGNVTKNDLYAIEILKDDNGNGNLGKWILPMSIDIQEILSQYPIEDLSNMKCFLKSCKHHVDSYMCRAKQLQDLQDSLLGITNARVSYTVGITRVELNLSRVQDSINNEVFNVILYLYYNSNQARPYKLLSDTDGSERPQANLLKRFSKYFKPFLKKDLSSAFQQISEAQSEFIWKKVLTDNNIEIYDKSDDKNTGFLSEFFDRGGKKLKKIKNKQRNKEDTSHDEMETSLYEEECTSIIKNKKRNYISRKDEIDSSKQKKQLAKPKIGSHSLKILHSCTQKSKRGISEIEEEDNQNITDANNPESTVENKTNCSWRQEESEKLDLHTESARKDKAFKNKSNHNNSKKELPKKANSKYKRTQSQKLYNPSVNANCEYSENSQVMKKKRKTITWIDEIRDKENHTILVPNDNEQVNMSCSTPLSKKIPHKSKFFHVSRISEILSTSSELHDNNKD